MNTVQNKAIVRRFFYELWNGRDLALADEIIAQNCITHQLRSGEDISGAERGPEAVRSHIQEWLRGFPDLQFRIEEMIAENELVVTRCEMSGRHTGEWMKIPPTNKTISIRMFSTHRIEGSRIVEDWVLVEALGYFQQLGLIGSMESILGARDDRDG